MKVDHLSGARASDEMLVNALLGEAETSLQSLKESSIEERDLALDSKKIETALVHMREVRSSRRIDADEGSPPAIAPVVEGVEDPPLPATPGALDQPVIQRCRELARRNLEIGRHAQVVLASHPWRRFGTLDPSASRDPPTTEELEEVRDLERKVQSGEIFRSLLGRSPGPQTSVTLAAPTTPLRLALLPVEQQTTWLPYLEEWDDEWKQLYQRDRHRCSSPVCERRDVTPHHIEFQAHGGTDELENMVSVCSWCHSTGSTKAASKRRARRRTSGG